MDRSFLRYRRLLGCLGLGVAALASVAPASAQQVIAGKGAVTIDLGVLNQLGQPVSQGYAPSGQAYSGYSQPLYGQPTYGQPYAPGYMQTYGGLQFPPQQYPASTLLVQPPAGAAPYVPQAASAPAMTAPAMTAPASTASTSMAPASASSTTASSGATGTPPPAPTPTPAAVPMATTDTSGAATTSGGASSATAPATTDTGTTTASGTGAATTSTASVPSATPLATTDTTGTAATGTTTTGTTTPTPPAATGTDTGTAATAATGTAATGTAPTGTATTETGTTQTASIPPAATTEGQIRITFPADSADIPDSVKGQLDALAQKMAGDENMRIQLLAYASGTSDQASRARRMSLSRALAVRSYLIKQGVRSTRMDVRALGNNVEGSPADRVDILPKTS